jgi:hypothetical protein
MKKLLLLLALVPLSARAQYIDGLPLATQPLPSTDIVTLCQGGTPGKPGTCKTVQAPLASLPSIPSVNGLPEAATNAALQAVPVGTYTLVYRAGFTTAGDGGTMVYGFSSSPCSLNAGAGDNGSQVAPSVGVGCWIWH